MLSVHSDKELSSQVQTVVNGYKEVRKVMMNGIKSYERKLAMSKLSEEDERFSPLHLPKTFRAGDRRDRKMLAKSNWFVGRMKGGEEALPIPSQADNIQQDGSCKGRRPPWTRRRPPSSPSPPGATIPRSGPSTVMFVPWTAHAILVGRLKAEEDRMSSLTDFRVKYAEAGGVQLWRHFSTKLAWLWERGLCHLHLGGV